METDPHPVMDPDNLTTNDDILDATPTSPIAPDNAMGVSDHDIEGPMSLYN